MSVPRRVESFLDLAAQRVVGLDDHFGQQLVEAVEHRVGQRLVQPGPAQHGIGAAMDQVADQFLVVLQRQPGPAHQRFDHRHVPPVGDRGGQHLADQRLPESQREGYTLLLAMRSWEFNAFERLRRVRA